MIFGCRHSISFLLFVATSSELLSRCSAFQPVQPSVVVGLNTRHTTLFSRTLEFTTTTTTTTRTETRLGLYLDQDDDDTHKSISDSNRSVKLEKEEESEDQKDMDKHKEYQKRQQSKMMRPTTTTKKNTEEEEEDEPSPLSSDTQNIIGTIFTAATNLYSLFIIGFATIVGCGLILNIMGYGYHFDLQQGLVIDTIEQMRTDRQLQQELMRVSTSTSPTTGIQQIPQSKPFSITEFFFHRPFFTTLLITGVVLGVETWFSSTTGNSNKNKDDK